MVEAWGYDNIVLEGIDGVVHIEQLSMQQQINEHATLSLSIMMDEDKVGHYLSSSLVNRKIILRHREKRQVLFNGIIKSSQVERINGIHYVQIQGISHTYNMDIEKMKRSYQDQRMTYQQFFRQVAQGYAHSDFQYSTELGNRPLNRFIMQYDETDWEFIKRVISRSNRGLIVDVKQEGAKCYVGLPEGREEIVIPKAAYQVRRDLARIQRIMSNGAIAQIDEADSLQYKLKNLFASYEIGDRVRFQDRSLIVVKKSSELVKQDGFLRHHYTLATLRGSQQEKRFNESLAGNSVAGTVIDVKSHYTKLHLHMDKEQSKDTATWFPQPTYFTGGEGKGYGAMPERGEVLYLHFPVSNEEINYVISSDGNDYDSIAKRIQASTQNPEPPESKKKTNNSAAAVPKKNRNPGQAINEDTIYRSKQWFSPGNKSLLLDDHQVKLHATDGASQITLLDGTGIIVSSTGSMELTAKNLRINPDFVGEQATIPAEGVNVMLTAGKNVVLLCEGSSMMMDEQDGSIHMLSETVRLESPENPMDIQVMSGDEVEALLAEYEQIRLGYQPVFLSDGTLVSSDNNDVLYNYFIKYVYKPDDQGTSPEKMFKAWRLEYYGKNSNEKKREYYGKSAEFVVKGNYADEVTGLGVGGSVLLGLTGVDFLADGRDLIHNFTHWEWSWGHLGEVGLNSLGLVPVIGAVKNLKYSDDVLALAKQAGNADDFIKGLNKMGALVDEAGNKFALRKLADGSYELINESGKVVKKIDGLPSAINELGVKIGKGNGTLQKNVDPWRKDFGKPSDGYGQLVKDLPKWDPMRNKLAQMLREVRQVGTVRRDVNDPQFFAAFGGESIETGMWFRYNPNNLRSVDMLEEIVHWQQYKKGLHLSGYSDEALELMAKRSIINNYNIGPELKKELLHDIQRVLDGSYTNPK